MNFQGRLLDSSGAIRPDGQYNMQFRIFSVASGGTALWTETRQTTSRVQVTNGLFTVQLGQVTPLPASLFNATDLFFEITMATPATATCTTAGCQTWESPMTPRNKLATSAFAFNAATLNGKSDTDFAAASGSANYIQNGTSPQTANLNITGAGTFGGNLTVSSGSHSTTIRSTNQGRGTSSNVSIVNGDGGSSRAAFYAQSGANTFEAGSTSGWSSKVTTAAANVGLVIQGASSQTADLLQLQNSGNVSLFRVAADGSLYVTDAASTSVLSANTSTGVITIGSAGNTVTLSANGISLAGTARNVTKVTLAPEYPGATFTGDGTNNTGSLSSDFCSGALNINDNGYCTGVTRNYYEWNADPGDSFTPQDYDIYVRYQIPSDYSVGSMTNLSIEGLSTYGLTSDSVTVSLYQDGSASACGVSSEAANLQNWGVGSIASPLGSCTINPGDMVTFRVHMVAESLDEPVRAGSISFNYLATR